jgi:carbonic anhydrase
MNRIIQGIQQFQRDVFPANRELFQRLASGQNPEALFITCADSRVSPEWVTQCGPGDLFVCRNAGNIVPGYGQTNAESATIEYAVSALGIKHIIVCGHSDCGAMKGLLHPSKLASMPDVRDWLRHADAAHRALESAPANEFNSDILATLTKLNVRLQLEHLATHPQVLAKLREGALQLHGWYYQIQSGEVQSWHEGRNSWVPVHESGSGFSGSGSREARHA